MKKYQILVVVFLLITTLFSLLTINTINQKREVNFSYYSDYFSGFVNNPRDFYNNNSIDTNKFDTKLYLIKDKSVLKDFEFLSERQLSCLKSVDYGKSFVVIVSNYCSALDRTEGKIVNVINTGNHLSLKTVFEKKNSDSKLNNDLNIYSDIILIEKSQVTLDGNTYFDVYNQFGNSVLSEIQVI